VKEFVIIVAGGSGRRMGSSVPKQFIPINGVPILMHTMKAFAAYSAQLELVLVLPEHHLLTWKNLVKEHNFTLSHKIALGGPNRFDSVRNGLNMLPSTGVVGIHDGVRPLVSKETIDTAYQTAREKGNAIPVVPMEESLREIIEEGSKAVPRDYFRKVQTPQCFRVETIKAAYAQPYRKEFTDDASVVEANGEKIFLVDGNRENLKITTPMDLSLAQTLLARD